jgi:hypothetical protein
VFQPGGPKPYPNIQPGCLEIFSFRLHIIDATEDGGGGEGGEGGGKGETEVFNYVISPVRSSDLICFRNTF